MRKKILIIIIVFIISFSLRLWNLNMMGRTWDESASTDIGYKLISLIEKRDFFNFYWVKETDHPPLTRYLYGIAARFDIEGENSNNNSEIPKFKYDITATRMVSVFFSSLSVALVTIIGIEFISLFVGFVSGVILAMLPFFLGLSQIATLESILFFFFTLSIYSYLRFLKNQTKINIVFAGVATGLSLLSKYTNILDVPIILISFWFYVRFSKKIVNKVLIFKKTIYVFIISAITFFIFWPMPWLNLPYVISYNFNWRILGNLQPDIEVFFGRLMHLPVFYYFVFFLITAPLFIIVLFLLGSKYISDYSTKKEIFKKGNLSGFISEKWFLYVLIAWFCIPFVQSFYNFRHHGIRFIIEIYAPLSIIAAIGFDRLVSRFTNKISLKLLMFIPVFLYLLIVLIRISPYYLDYFNIVVGGTKTVYDKGLFEIGWWGQGIGEAGYYIRDHAKKGSTIGLAISPIEVFPDLPEFKESKYNAKIKYDYVVVNYFHILREGFNDSEIRRDYKLIYTVKADGGILVYVYKKISSF